MRSSMVPSTELYNHWNFLKGVREVSFVIHNKPLSTIS